MLDYYLGLFKGAIVKYKQSLQCWHDADATVVTSDVHICRESASWMKVDSIYIYMDIKYTTSGWTLTPHHQQEIYNITHPRPAL